MAIYHLSIKIIGRSSGRSAVASSAYRSGSKLYDEQTGLSHDFTKKSGIAYSEIVLCKDAPKEYCDRETLWNAVQQIEKSADAQLAREFELALPHELSIEQKIELSRWYAASLADEGMCVDFSIHDLVGNSHVHMMTTTRPIEENGKWGTKEKKAYALDEEGNKIPVIDPQTGEQKIGARGRKIWKRVTVESNDWNKREKVEEWRERWAKYCNEYLKPEHQIDHRSYLRQGKEIIPTIHEGYVSRQIEKKGQQSDRVRINQEIREINKEVSKLQKAEQEITVSKNKLFDYIRAYTERLKREFEEKKRRLMAFKEKLEQRQIENRKKSEYKLDEGKLYSLTTDYFRGVFLKNDNRHYVSKDFIIRPNKMEELKKNLVNLKEELQAKTSTLHFSKFYEMKKKSELKSEIFGLRLQCEELGKELHEKYGMRLNDGIYDYDGATIHSDVLERNYQEAFARVVEKVESAKEKYKSHDMPYFDEKAKKELEASKYAFQSFYKAIPDQYREKADEVIERAINELEPFKKGYVGYYDVLKKAKEEFTQSLSKDGIQIFKERDRSIEERIRRAKEQQKEKRKNNKSRGFER